MESKNPTRSHPFKKKSYLSPVFIFFLPQATNTEYSSFGETLPVVLQMNKIVDETTNAFVNLISNSCLQETDPCWHSDALKDPYYWLCVDSTSQQQQQEMMQMMVTIQRLGRQGQLILC